MKKEILNKEKFLKIIEKFLENKCTKEEEALIINFYESFQNNKEWHEEYGIEKDVKEIIHLRILNSISESELPQRKTKKLKLIWKYAAAASIAVLLATSLFFNFKNETLHKQPVLGKKDIKIGTNKAILTLENGEQVQLEKGKVYNTQNAKSNGEQLIYAEKADSQKNTNEEMAYNVLTIPRGGEFFIQLEDKTKVWLNSETKFKYPTKFIEGQPRVVELLYGEAYFDVSHSSNHKGATFNVNSGAQEIEVLGTEFNVKFYKNDNKLYTTLVKGKVTIDNNISKKVLSPGQQSILSSGNNDITILNVDISYEIAWKNGLFMFDKKSLKEITVALSRWYDIKVVFENQEKQKLIMSGILKRSDHIEELLKNFERTGEIKYTISENTLIIK